MHFQGWQLSKLILPYSEKGSTLKGKGFPFRADPFSEEGKELSF